MSSSSSKWTITMSLLSSVLPRVVEDEGLWDEEAAGVVGGPMSPPWSTLRMIC